MSVVVQDIAIGTGGFGLDSHAGQIKNSRQRVATATVFLWSCVSTALAAKMSPVTCYKLWRNTAGIMNI